MDTAKRDSYYCKEPWTLAGTNFALGSYEKFKPAFQDKNKGKDPGDEFWCEIRERKQQGEIQQAMVDDAIQVAIIHRGDRAEMLISENFQPTCCDAGWKNRASLGNRESPPSHTNTSKISRRI